MKFEEALRETYGLIQTHWMDGSVVLWAIDEEVGHQQITGKFEFAGRQVPVYVGQARGTTL